MRHEELQILCSDEIRAAIETNLNRKVEAVALDKHIPHAALVATQVKYLQRSRLKLPAYYAARCIIPPLSFEQASSQRAAAVKQLSGDSILDLTCGLGVDALHFASSFRRVVTLERDEVLSEVARQNFKRMGIGNIEVVCCEAQEYVAACTESFDWIYADPDRRGAKGEKLVRLEECSPNILALKDDIERISKGRFMIKNSPLFDVDEAFKLFSPARVEVVSLHDECKEVLVCSSDEDTLVATAIDRGSVSVARREVEQLFAAKEFDAQHYKYLIIPDVALQKARLVSKALSGQVDIWSNNGFGFAPCKCDNILGRSFEIERVEQYNPKALRRELGGCAVEILKRDFPYSTQKIKEQLKIKEGAERRVAFTRVAGQNLAIFLK